MRIRCTLRASVAVTALAMGASFALTACNTEPAESIESGTVSLPLRVDVDGTTFALSGTLTLARPGTTLSETVDETDTRTEIQFRPRVGNYALSLEPGWTLHREEPAGSDVFVVESDAELTSPNPQDLTVSRGSVINAELLFDVPGRGPIVFASGTVNVRIGVNDGFPTGHSCNASEECASHVCTAGVCEAATCSDGVLNGTETSPDCGPECPPCVAMDGGAGGSDAGTSEPALSVSEAPPLLAWRYAPADGDPWPDHTFVAATPAVADVNGDGTPDIVFGAGTAVGGLQVPGVLRVVSGDGVSEIFTAGTPTINVAAAPAVGDLDGDGQVEIVCASADGTRLIAFSHTGAVEWTSAVLETITWGAPAIGNVLGSALAEVVIGRQVLDGATGTLVWTGGLGRGMNGSLGPHAVIADLDQNGLPEVVTGNTAYRADGVVFYTTGLADGFPAVADFDEDGTPELVVVSQGMLRVHNGLDGSLRWQVALPGAPGGAPVIADVDADGRPEIGVAARTDLVVFSGDGTLLWQAPINDQSSGVASASAFDFDADGRAEVLLHDQRGFRIYEGATGEILFEVVQPSALVTFVEYPLVADLDGDGRAEIIDPLNSLDPAVRGLDVYAPLVGSWASARGVWNQYSYHVTNVNDDGSIPSVEPASWLAGGPNSYREQR